MNRACACCSTKQATVLISQQIPSNSLGTAGEGRRSDLSKRPLSCGFAVWLHRLPTGSRRVDAMACKRSGVQIPSAPPQLSGPPHHRLPANSGARAADTQQPALRHQGDHRGRRSREPASPGSSPGRRGPSGCRRRRGRVGRLHGPSTRQSPVRELQRPPARWQRYAAGHGATQVQVGELGPSRIHRGLVDPPQVVGGQRSPGASNDAVAAAGSWKDEVLGAGAAGELSADRLADPLAHGHHPHAGQALGLGLEAAAEPAGFVADLDDLNAPQLREDPAAAQPQEFATAQPGPGPG
jgi:hypothetical protein